MATLELRCKALHVVAKAEDNCFIRFFVVVTTDTLEHAGTVMKGMGQNVRRCLLPRHHFARSSRCT